MWSAVTSSAAGTRGAPRKACPSGPNLPDVDHDGFPDVYGAGSGGAAGAVGASGDIVSASRCSCPRGVHGGVGCCVNTGSCDNCPSVYNKQQRDLDKDHIGDVRSAGCLREAPSVACSLADAYVPSTPLALSLLTPNRGGFRRVTTAQACTTPAKLTLCQARRMETSTSCLH